MWFRVLLAGWSLAFLALLGWFATHESSAPTILGRYSNGYFAMLVGLAAAAGAGLLAQLRFLYRRLHSVRWEIVLTASTIVISLVVIEVAIRMLDPFGLSYFSESSRYHLDKLRDPVLVHKHAPGLIETYQGVTVSINDLGLRDRSVREKSDDELRILLLGDSVTFGWGVPADETFGRRLEGMLASKLGRTVRTVNTGVGGYNTAQELASLTTYAGVVDPDLVVLLYVGNDVEPSDARFDPWSQASLEGKSPPEIVGVLLKKSWTYRLGLFAFKLSRSEEAVSFDRSARGVRESMDALAAMASDCRERGAPFVVFFYRSAGEPLEGIPSELISEIRTVGQEHGFPVGDVGEWWGDVDVQSVTNSTIDSHPNGRGHEIMAAGMADFLISGGLVEETTAASR